MYLGGILLATLVDYYIYFYMYVSIVRPFKHKIVFMTQIKHWFQLSFQSTIPETNETNIMMSQYRVKSLIFVVPFCEEPN